MIIGFEDYTHELTDFEMKNVFPIIVKGLQNRRGKKNAVSNKYICQTLNDKKMFGNYKLTGSRVRKIINHIRMTGTIIALCSCQKGYFIANTKDELYDYIDGLSQRIDSQQRVHDALVFQLKEIL